MDWGLIGLWSGGCFVCRFVRVVVGRGLATACSVPTGAETGAGLMRMCQWCGVRREHFQCGWPQFISGGWWQVWVCSVCSRTVIAQQGRG